MLRINFVTSGSSSGLPAFGRDFHRQYQRKLLRCQPTTVFGRNSIRLRLQPPQTLESNPEQSIAPRQPRPGMSALQNQNLLTKGKHLRDELLSSPMEQSHEIT